MESKHRPMAVSALPKATVSATHDDRLKVAVSSFRMWASSERASRKILIERNEDAILAVYSLFFPFSTSAEDWKTFCLAQGWNAGHTGRFPVSAALKGLLGRYGDRSFQTRMSEWATVITQAANENIDPGQLIPHIRKLGGITAAAKASRARNQTETNSAKLAAFKIKFADCLEQTNGELVPATAFSTSLPHETFQVCLVRVGSEGNVSVVAHTNSHSENSDVALFSKVLKAAEKAASQ